MKSRFSQTFEYTVACFLRAELSGEDLGVEEWGKVQDDNTLAFGILASSHLGIGGCKKRVRLHLDCPTGTTGEGAITAIDRFGVAAKEKIRKA